MIKPCDICGGSKTVTLPIRVMPMYSADAKAAPREASRTYPCPECGTDTVGYDQIAMNIPFSAYDVHHADPAEIDRYVQNQAANAVADLIMREGLLKVRKVKEEYHMTTYRCTVGFVSWDKIKPMEDRIAERQFDVAQGVVDDGLARIGSKYRNKQGIIRETDVYNEFRDTLRDWRLS